MSLDLPPPVLYSFRRCPYAMRARLAILASGLSVELREIVLREKAPEFLASSPKGTVPVLVTPTGVIEESFDVMLWALERSDPQGWLEMPEAGYDWIARCDGPFKTALDHTKYAVRYPDLDPEQERGRAAEFLADLNLQMASSDWLLAQNAPWQIWQLCLLCGNLPTVTAAGLMRSPGQTCSAGWPDFWRRLVLPRS